MIGETVIQISSVLPCTDGCKQLNNGQCKYVKDCEKDITLGLGLYYFWEKGRLQPKHKRYYNDR